MVVAAGLGVTSRSVIPFPRRKRRPSCRRGIASAPECAAKQRVETLPMPLRRRLVVHGALGKGEPVGSARINLHFCIGAAVLSFGPQLVDDLLRRILIGFGAAEIKPSVGVP